VALRQEEFTSLSDDVDLDRDRVLVERCQAGDSGAFGNLYARYYERLLRFCLRRLNDRHEAEDAAQEAFARAWKALPNFAGERRFYPWLTVIAGNICTDMLRRRSRSTPTDDLELSAQQQVGGGGHETSEELVLAAVDGELVNKALDRLSVRHRHVLAMREGSGWTYQQIADHEGVEIGTIETLLWRARQALKREFTVLSESKGMLGGFLAGAGALLRRGFLRMAHRSAHLQQSGGTGGFRNALAGMAFTSAAVAAALITPHALSASGSSGSTPSPSAASSLASLGTPASTSLLAASGATGSGASGAGGGGASSNTGATPGSSLTKTGSSSVTGASDAASGLTGASNVSGALGGLAGSGSGSGLSETATTLVGGTAGNLSNTASGAVSTLTGGILAPVLAPVTGLLSGSTPTSGGANTTGNTTATLPLVGPVTQTVTSTIPETVTSTVKQILGGL
jgi:RNA polymerase sigma-70 factor, ECF subfamily